MIQPASCAIELDRDGDPGGNSGSHAKEETKTKAVTDSEDDGIRYGAGQQPQRTVLPAQQIVREIETAQHIETGSRDADSCDCVMVHSAIVRYEVLCGRRHSALVMLGGLR
jgi:hypothetical protein